MLYIYIYIYIEREISYLESAQIRGGRKPNAKPPKSTKSQKRHFNTTIESSTRRDGSPTHI